MLTIIVLLILLLFAIRGYRNGLVKSIVSFASIFISAILVAYLTPYVSEYMENSTRMHAYIAERCEETFSIKMNEITAQNSAGGKITKVQDAMIDQLPLPNIVKENLKKYNNVRSYEQLGAKNFNEYVPRFIANMIIRACVFVITWILVMIGLYILVRMLNLITELPAIKGVNRWLGVGLGVFQGLICVWILFLGITMIGGTNLGSDLLEMISRSKFLEFLYDTNLVLRIIQKVMASLF